MTSWAVAQMGARMHYAVPRILHEAGILDRFYTDICAAKGWPYLFHAIPGPLRPAVIQRLLARVPAGVPAERIKAFNAFGIHYAWRKRQARNQAEGSAVDLWACDCFSELALEHGIGESELVYGFNAGCLPLYEGVKESGGRVVMEQVIAPRLAQERILEAEYRQAPAWTQFETNPNAAEIGRREKVAWKLVDRIVCGSQFVSDEIAAEGGPADKCVVVPYGVRTSEFRAASPRPVREALPLRVLFVGSVGLRKGVPYLLEAARRLGPDKVRCRLVGGFSAPADVLQREAPANVELVGSVPRSQIAREYANADVFCLPSLCEGSATVIYEALAAGLPVLTTPNAGSIVRDGVEGYIVPIRNAEAIADRLAHLASDPARLKEMSRAAAERSEYGSLVSYGRRLLGVLREMN